MRKQGFTLIELLTVIAIMSMLAAVLIPVFFRASEKAKQANCASNARSIALSVLVYASDYEETLPPVAYIDQSKASTITWIELLHTYTKNSALFRCPSDRQTKTSSYGLNTLVFADLSNSAVHQTVQGLGAIQTPSATIMLAETGMDDYSVKAPSDGLDILTPVVDPIHVATDLSPRHGNLINVAFLDGHVTALTPHDLYVTLAAKDQ